MDQRLKNLEDLSELLTKEMVQQNKSMIETNKNLLVEIKSLREAFVKQDEDFDEFKNLLKKIYDLNKQQGLNQNQMPPMHTGQLQQQQQYHHQQHHQQYSSGSSQQQMPPSISLNNLNNSYMVDQVNQSMLNNLSFQSERTPLNVNQQNPNASCYSIPSSASAMMMNQQNQFTPYLNNQLPPNQQQQQQQLPGMVASQKSTPSYQPNGKPTQPQYQNMAAGAAGGPNFKPIPASPVVQGMYQQNLPQQQPQTKQQQPPVPVPVPQGTKPFSFSNLNKPPVAQNGTDAVKLEQQQQRQIFNVPPPIAQTTSTPQSSQLFPTSKIQPNQDSAKPKPPQFQLSPTKQSTETVTSTMKPFGQLSTAPPTTVTAPAPSLFGSNLFKTAAPPTAPLTTTKPMFSLPDTMKTSTITPAAAAGDEEEGTTGNPEEFEPQVDFKPIVKLQEVETKTGEEDEEVLLKHRCKLFRFNLETKEWKEKGLGDIKFLKNKSTGAIRILMRREQVLKICANHRINPSMTIKEISNKQYSWLATDFSENEPKSELLLAKFKLAEEATEFKNEFEKSVLASASLSKTNTPVKPAAGTKDIQAAGAVSKLSQLIKSDKWNCTACYAPNNKTDIKCMCCATLKPGATEAEIAAAAPQPAKPSGQFSFGAPKPTAEASPTKPAFSFGSMQPAAGVQAPPKAPFSFGAPTQATSATPKLDFSAKIGVSPTKQASPLKEGNSLFQNKDMPTFGSLASAPGKSLFGDLSKTGSNQFSGGIQALSQPAKPLFGAAFQTPTLNKDENAEDTEQQNDNPEEFVPQADFKPIVKLDKVETVTGEENEDVVFKARSKLYRFDNTLKEWKEKGTGEMKILKNKEHNNMYRILMRRDQVLKLCANHRITIDLKFEIQNEKQVRWHAEDYSEGSGKHELLAARFKHESEAKQFFKECETALEILKNEPHIVKTPSKPKEDSSCAGLKSKLTDMFKNDDTWKCNACYAPNKKDVIKCACCSTLKPGATEPAAPVIENKLTSTFGQISFGAKPTDTTAPKAAPIVFGSQANEPKPEEKAGAKFDFGSSKTGLFGNQTSGSSLFGNQAPATGMFGQAAPKSDSSSIFNNSSFADLANKTQPTGFGGGFGSGGFGSVTQAKPMFGTTFGSTPATPATGGEGEEAAGENPEEFVPQADFKPLVKLDKVDTVTGEEDEIVLYKNRCKLFRFNNELKEWREKGVGDIKILKHKIKENHFRVLMRREQVLKLCANHRINPSIKLDKLTEKQMTWYVQDCSEDEPHPEILLAKFRHEEDATRFKVEFEKVQKILLENPAGPGSPSTVKTVEKAPNKLSSLVAKTAEGSWKCDGCLTVNKPGVMKCVCCQSDAPFDDAVIIIETKVATKEQVEKARKFQLPDNFYLYECKEKCKGCRGCEQEYTD